MQEAVADTDVIFDVASQPAAHVPIISQIPDGSSVLIQKPMGNNLTEAREIVDLCQSKNLAAAINFQLRFCPQMLAIRDFIAQGHLGEPVDLEVHINLRTPWELFPFLKDLARVEIALHSIHYLDLIRSLVGNPQGVFARTIPHPKLPEFAQTKTSAILNYGDQIRCCLSINHGHDFGELHEQATIRVEGTKGCAVATLGVLMDYPKGKPDLLDVISPTTDGWQPVDLEGNWFPDAFVGRMANMQRFVNGEDQVLEASVEDAFGTMALVEAMYTADAHGGFPLQTLE
jgi:predicted dehydrogenase